jgi:Tol biopolymer transport system component
MIRIALIGLVALVLLAPAPGASEPRRETIAFTRDNSIFVARADGTNVRLLLRNAAYPRYSPDASKLAFVRRVRGDEEIYVANGDGTRPKRVTHEPGPDLTPAWSSDGRQLAYTHAAEIWRMNADGAGKQRLVGKHQVWHEAYAPAWHGGRLVYAALRVNAFNTELYRYPARRLTFTRGGEGVLGDDSMPGFSPDGARIAFTSSRQGDADIWVMNANGSQQRPLLRKAGSFETTPRWSRDGTRIAFAALGPRTSDVWVVRADGSGPRRLVSGGADPEWRP